MLESDDVEDAIQDQVTCSALSGEDCQLEERVNLGIVSQVYFVLDPDMGHTGKLC